MSNNVPVPLEDLTWAANREIFNKSLKIMLFKRHTREMSVRRGGTIMKVAPGH